MKKIFFLIDCDKVLELLNSDFWLNSECFWDLDGVNWWIVNGIGFKLICPHNCVFCVWIAPSSDYVLSQKKDQQFFVTPDRGISGLMYGSQMTCESQLMVLSMDGFVSFQNWRIRLSMLVRGEWFKPLKPWPLSLHFRPRLSSFSLHHFLTLSFSSVAIFISSHHFLGLEPSESVTGVSSWNHTAISARHPYATADHECRGDKKPGSIYTGRPWEVQLRGAAQIFRFLRELVGCFLWTFQCVSLNFDEFLSGFG